MALTRRIYLDPDLVAQRASEFPLIRNILGDRVEAVINGKTRAGCDYAHAIVDDHSRLAYVELHADERAATVTVWVPKIRFRGSEFAGGESDRFGTRCFVRAREATKGNGVSSASLLRHRICVRPRIHPAWIGERPPARGAIEF